MELLQVEKKTGKSPTEIASEVKELSNQREALISEIEDLQSQEVKAKELKSEVEESEKKVQKLRVQNEKLLGEIGRLIGEDKESLPGAIVGIPVTTARSPQQVKILPKSSPL